MNKKAEIKKGPGFIKLFEDQLDPLIASEEALEALGRQMLEGTRDGSIGLDAGYVYLGQFISHDMTHLERGKDQPSTHGVESWELVQLRSPPLDLDSVYGRGWEDARCHKNEETGEMLLGTTRDDMIERFKREIHFKSSQSDLPRDEKTFAPLIPDERNDENLLIAQLHVLFLKLHNHMVRNKPDSVGDDPKAIFEFARREVTKLYQGVVVHDYLKELLDEDMYDAIVVKQCRGIYDFAEYKYAMPLEFSGAAGRFGHSMVRPTYKINLSTIGRRIEDLLQLVGKRAIAKDNGLSEKDVVDWNLFFSAPDKPLRNPALHIDPLVVLKIPPIEQSGKAAKKDALAQAISINLAARNLVRGVQMKLPSAQDLVRALRAKHPELNESNLPILESYQFDSLGLLEALDDKDRESLREHTPLWFYVLGEASHPDFGAGRRLGPLGSLIVGSVIMEFVRESEHSIFQPGWSSSIIPSKELFPKMQEIVSELTKDSGETETPPRSPKATIDKFIGTWQVKERDHANTSDSIKDSYYPPAGVEIKLTRYNGHETFGNHKKSTPEYLRGEVVKGEWEGKEAFENAYLYFYQGKLISTPIPTDIPDSNNEKELNFGEVAILTGSNSMKHYLLWSDGDMGCWGCLRIA